MIHTSVDTSVKKTIPDKQIIMCHMKLFSTLSPQPRYLLPNNHIEVPMVKTNKASAV
mgnify:CR=1 FL=1